MVNEIIDGICRALNGEFGEEYHIYTEKIEQRFTRPCFFVEIKESSMELFRGERYFMDCTALVTYYPPYKGKNEDMAQVSQRVSLCTQIIDVDGAPLRCSGCRHTTDKESITSELKFGFFVRKTDNKEDRELMQEYTLTGLGKEE